MFSPEDEDLYDSDDHLYRMKTTTTTSSYGKYGQQRDLTPNRNNLKEASEHLRLLRQRVTDLEDIIKSQGVALTEKDVGYRKQLKELKESKERQIVELTQVIARLEQRNQELALEAEKTSDERWAIRSHSSVRSSSS